MRRAKPNSTLRQRCLGSNWFAIPSRIPEGKVWEIKMNVQCEINENCILFTCCVTSLPKDLTVLLSAKPRSRFWLTVKF